MDRLETLTLFCGILETLKPLETVDIVGNDETAGYVGTVGNIGVVRRFGIFGNVGNVWSLIFFFIETVGKNSFWSCFTLLWPFETLGTLELLCDIVSTALNDGFVFSVGTDRQPLEQMESLKPC